MALCRCGAPREIRSKCHACHARYQRSYRATNVARCQAISRKSRAKWRKTHPEERQHQRRLYNRARDARLRGAGQVQQIDPEAIWNRDSRRCHLCHKPVSREDLSLDHLIPVSAGGAHSPENVATAHRLCNMRRQHRGPAQLRLIG